MLRPCQRGKLAWGSKEQEYVYVGSFVPKALLNTLAIMKLVEGEFR